MIQTQKRSRSSMMVSKAAIEQATSRLQELPEKPREIWSLREAVNLLQDSISDTLSKGYSYEEVARMLSDKGVEISPSSLKSYLSVARRQKHGVDQGSGRRTGRRLRKSIALPADQSDLTAIMAPIAIAESEENGAAKTTKRRTKATQASSEEPTKTAAKTRATARSKPQTAKPQTARRGRKKA